MNDKKIIFSMQGVSKTLKDKKILNNIWLSFFYGAKIGVLGLNGAGKSTLLRIIAGEDKEYDGDITSSQGVTFGYLPQEPRLDPELTVYEAVQGGLQEIVDWLAEFEEISAKFAEPDADFDALIAQQATVQEKIDAVDGWELEQRLSIAMDALRCPPPDTKVGVLSGGEMRRVALCKLLLSKPDVLLLDEPTNHLDAETVGWLEQFLQRYEGTVIAVTHDRYFLDNVAGWILELDRGEGIPFEGNYSGWLEQKEARLRNEERSENKRQKALARELEWVKQSPKGRQSKSKARIARYDTLLSAEGDKAREDLELPIPPGPRLGDVVIDAQNVRMALGDKLLYDNLNFRLPPGGIVGIIGPNGAGKTTLFRLITGQLEPLEGSFKVGETVKIAYADQGRTLQDDRQVWQEIADGLESIQLGSHSVQARAYAGRFNFTGSAQQKLVRELSGGERNRVHMAKTLKEGGNVLLLDEPTNDLDVNTLRALEDALLNFGGCAVVISHDRWFLDRVATHILAFEGDSHVEWFEGNFAEYEEDRRKRLGQSEPKPIRYKPLER